MTTTTVKTTYDLDLDLETVGALDMPPQPLQALDELQKALAVAPAVAARWSSQGRAERRAGSRRREAQTR